MKQESPPLPFIPKQVCVLFDTNAIHPASNEEQLVSSRLIDYANLRNSVPYQLQLCIPDIVFRERRYQIRQKAGAKWDSATASLRILRQDSPLTREEAVDRLCNDLEKDISGLGVEILSLDCAKVDLAAICEASIERKPPFSVNGEKGFRDSVILATAYQFIERLREKTPQCHIILVTGDKLIESAISTHALATRVEVVADHSSALTRLVALGRGLSHSEIQSILLQADEIFLSKDWKSGLLRDSGLEERLPEEHKEQILDPLLKENIPASFEKTGFFVSTPSLVKVEENIWHFVTLLEFQGCIWLGGSSSDIDFLETSILKVTLKRRVLDANYSAALFTMLAITFRVDWTARSETESKLKDAAIISVAPYTRKRFGSDYQFSGQPELIGIKINNQEENDAAVRLENIDPNCHAFAGRPTWLDNEANKEVDGTRMKPRPSI